MRSSILIIVTLLIVSGCCSVTRPPGQVVASENHFEDGKDGIKQYEKGHVKQAIHQFEMAIEKNPANFKAYYYLGLCYKYQGVRTLEKVTGERMAQWWSTRRHVTRKHCSHRLCITTSLYLAVY